MAKVYRETRTVTWVNEHWDYEKHCTVQDSTGSCPVRLYIDIDKLFTTLGRKAARSKGGKAVLHGGTITMKRGK